jgi:hypothetical protein
MTCILYVCLQQSLQCAEILPAIFYSFLLSSSTWSVATFLGSLILYSMLIVPISFHSSLHEFHLITVFLSFPFSLWLEKQLFWPPVFFHSFCISISSQHLILYLLNFFCVFIFTLILFTKNSTLLISS